jgi:NADPH2:quinone reductase
LTSSLVEVQDWVSDLSEKVIRVRVVEVAEFGGPEVLRIKQVRDAAPAPGEVAVEVAAAGVLSVDGVIRRGHGGDYFPVRPPYVPGMGVAGVVVSTGAGVDQSWVGRRVLVNLTGGGYATRVVTAVENLIDVPDALGLPQAMALLHDGSTALALLEATPVESGESVLVQPAAGGLAMLLIQLLTAAGARVVAAARGSQKLAVVKELGADVTVDYGDDDWTAQVGTVDVAFDGVGGELGRGAFEAVRRGGRFSSYGNASGTFNPVTAEEAGRREVAMRGMEQLAGFRGETRRRIEHLLKLAAQGSLQPIIGRTYPLDQAAEAHAAMEARSTHGKTLLIP